MGNINPEIAAFQAAVYGEDVRQAIIDLAEKLNEIVEQVVIDTDRDILVGYKSINPSDYSNLLANVNIAAVFPAEAGDWQDAPSNNAYTIINTKRSGNYNLQIAYGLIGNPNLYWRMINRTTHEVYQDWTTDDTPIDPTLSESGAAADAAAVRAALAGYVTRENAEVEESLSMYPASETHGNASVSLGWRNTASGEASCATGANTRATAYAAHAEGESTNAEGRGSHAEGRATSALGEAQHVQGRWNIADNSNQYAHIVGNGTGANARSNAHTLDWSGNAWFAGGVELNDTATGTRYRITVENGALKLTALT